MNAERAAMLLAFKSEDEILTRREIMTRAGVDNRHQFESLRAARYIFQREWGGAAVPREYGLTQDGKIKREMHNVAENLRYG